MYPEYTGTGLTVVLKQPVEYDKQTVYDKVKAGYEEKYQMTIDKETHSIYNNHNY